jgi:hypothetical protein
MANYYSFMVTEKSFQVENSEAFEEEMRKLGIVPDNWDGGLTFVKEMDGSYWVGGYDCDLSIWSEEKGDYIDVVPFIQKHMRSDTIWVVKHVGHEKLCYVTGWAGVITKHRCKYGDLDRLARGLEKRILLQPKRTIMLLQQQTPQQVESIPNSKNSVRGSGDCEKDAG